MTTTRQSGGSSVEQAISGILGSPWLWGTAGAFVFYAALPSLPIPPHYSQRYFAANWMEHGLVALFFAAVCQMLLQLKQIFAERGALKRIRSEVSADQQRDAVTLADAMQTRLDELPKRYFDTVLIGRVRDAVRFVISHQSSHGLDDQIRFAVEIDRRRLEQGDSLLRGVIRAIPLLGITSSMLDVSEVLARISNEKFDTWPEVTGSLAICGDCLVVALGMMVALVLGRQITDQWRQGTLDSIDDFCLNQLPVLLPQREAAAVSPLRLAEQTAANQLLANSESMIGSQVELWRQSLEELRERWSSTLFSQQDAIDQMLKAGLKDSLASYGKELIQARSEFLTAFERAAESIGASLHETRSALNDQQQQGCQQIADTWQQFRTEITKTRDEHARQLALLTQAITAEVGAWQNQMESSTQQFHHQFHELRAQGEVFLKLSDNEAQLVRLEGRLADNLEAVRVVEVLENTMMSLNAVVNLLTSRVKLNAA